MFDGVLDVTINHLGGSVPSSLAWGSTIGVHEFFGVILACVSTCVDITRVRVLVINDGDVLMIPCESYYDKGKVVIVIHRIIYGPISIVALMWMFFLCFLFQ